MEKGAEKVTIFELKLPGNVCPTRLCKTMFSEFYNISALNFAILEFSC